MVARLVGGCVRRLFLLVLLAAGLLLAWLYRDVVRDAWSEARARWMDAPPSGPSAELARTAEWKLLRLAAPESPDRIALSEDEIQSLVLYGLSGLVPPMLDSPRVRLEGGRVHLSARVPTDRLPAGRELGELAGFLPDTTELAAIAQVIPHDDVRAALQVSELTAARIPLPQRMIPGVLDALGRTAEPSLPADAYALPLPPGARAAYVSGDSLVLLARSPGLDSPDR